MPVFHRELYEREVTLVDVDGNPSALTVTGTVTVGAAVNQGTGGTSAWKTDGSAVTQPVSVADGADVALGAKADTAATGDTGTWSLIALFKRLLARLTTLMGQLPAALVSGRLDVNLGAAPALLTVQGDAAAGSAVAGNPVLSGGSDGTNARAFKVNTDGTLPVGGFTGRQVATLTTKTTAFAATQDMGGLITLTNVVRLANGSGVIESVVLSDKSKQSAALDVVFFESNPSATTFTDGTALAVNVADVVRIIGCVSIAATDYVAFSANSVATKGALGIPLVVSGGSANLYVALVCRGTPTYAGANDLQLTVGVAQD